MAVEKNYRTTHDENANDVIVCGACRKKCVANCDAHISQTILQPPLGAIPLVEHICLIQDLSLEDRRHFLVDWPVLFPLQFQLELRNVSVC